MKLKKFISIFLICILLTSILSGCKENEQPTEPVAEPEVSEPAKDLDEALKDAINWDDPEKYDDKEEINIDVNIGNDDENKDEGTYVEIPLPEDWDGMAIDPEVDVEKVIWEKEFSEIGLNSIRINNKWDEYIIVGGAHVSALERTDFSVMPNFFFDESYQPSDVQTAYFVPQIGLLVQRQFPFTNLISGLLDVEATSGKNNLFVERINYTLLHNPYEGSLTQLDNAVEYEEGEIGIGSKYSDVIAALGEPTNVDEFDSGTGYKNIIMTYGTSTTRLLIELSLINSSDNSNAIVTGIDWVAMSIKEQLRMQDGIEDFVGYVPTEPSTEETIPLE